MNSQPQPTQPQPIQVPIRDCTHDLLLTMGVEKMRIIAVIGDLIYFAPQLVVASTDKVVTVTQKPSEGTTQEVLDPPSVGSTP